MDDLPAVAQNDEHSVSNNVFIQDGNAVVVDDNDSHLQNNLIEAPSIEETIAEEEDLDIAEEQPIIDHHQHIAGGDLPHHLQHSSPTHRQNLLRQQAQPDRNDVRLQNANVPAYNMPPPQQQQQPPIYQQQVMSLQRQVNRLSLGQLGQRSNSRNNILAANNNNASQNHLLGMNSHHNNGPVDDTWSAPERSDFDDDIYSYTPPSGWSLVDRSSETAPSARSLHAAAIWNGVWYCFGGYDGTQRVNTFDAFSFAEKRWTPVLPSAASGPPPSPRDRHVAVTHNNSFYVHGGFDGSARVSDFWSFDFGSMTWRLVTALQGRPPSPRHSHAAVVHNNSMYLFGGYDGSYKSDLHEFDFQTLRWNVVSAAGRRPRARYRATCVVHKNDMILYGGHDGTRHLSDTHILDLENRIWTALVTEGIPPTPRDSHVCVWHGNSMYVFGGSSGSAMNDLHELAFSSEGNAPRWRVIASAAGTDQPRHRFCHVATVYQDSMFVFGGYDGSDRLNDLCRFDFAQYDMSFEVPQSTLVADFKSLVNDSTLSDVTFIVDGHDSEPINAHKLMLIRCPYFQSLFLGQMRESRMGTISIGQVSYSIFMSVLEYLYTDQTRITFANAMELFEAADLFCIPRLKTMCEKRMLQSITIENAATIFHAADMHSATALRLKSKKYILSNFEDVSKSTSFEEMGRSNIDLVFELLKSR